MRKHIQVLIIAAVIILGAVILLLNVSARKYGKNPGVPIPAGDAQNQTDAIKPDILPDDTQDNLDKEQEPGPLTGPFVY